MGHPETNPGEDKERLQPGGGSRAGSAGEIPMPAEVASLVKGAAAPSTPASPAVIQDEAAVRTAREKKEAAQGEWIRTSDALRVAEDAGEDVTALNAENERATQAYLSARQDLEDALVILNCTYTQEVLENTLTVLDEQPYCTFAHRWIMTEQLCPESLDAGGRELDRTAVESAVTARFTQLISILMRYPDGTDRVELTDLCSNPRFQSCLNALSLGYHRSKEEGVFRNLIEMGLIVPIGGKPFKVRASRLTTRLAAKLAKPGS